jgi:hypothetical protein
MSLTGEETPQEKEERLQSREDRLGKQNERLKERQNSGQSGSGGSSLFGGSSPGRLGSPHANGESFIGEHKVGIMVAAGLCVLGYYLWTAHTNSSTAVNALSAGTAAAPQGGTAAGPNVGTTGDAGTTYGIQQLTNQLAAIQTSLTTNAKNQAYGTANVPAATGGDGPQSLISIAKPDATNVAKVPTYSYDSGYTDPSIGVPNSYFQPNVAALAPITYAPGSPEATNAQYAASVQTGNTYSQQYTTQMDPVTMAARRSLGL